MNENHDTDTGDQMGLITRPFSLLVLRVVVIIVVVALLNFNSRSCPVPCSYPIGDHHEDAKVMMEQ